MSVRWRGQRTPSPSDAGQALKGMTERDDVDGVLRRETNYTVDETQAVDLELRPGLRRSRCRAWVVRAGQRAAVVRCTLA
jgi:hypothetical protein